MANCDALPPLLGLSWWRVRCSVHVKDGSRAMCHYCNSLGELGNKHFSFGNARAGDFWWSESRRGRLHVPLVSQSHSADTFWTRSSSRPLHSACGETEREPEKIDSERLRRKQGEEIQKKKQKKSKHSGGLGKDGVAVEERPR